MKANRAHRLAAALHARAASQHAVSSVVSAVLIFGLFATLMTMYTVTTLPKWIQDNEEAHHRDVKQAFDSLKAALDASAASDSTSPVGLTVPLAADQVPLLQASQYPGTLAVRPGFDLAASFTNPTVFLAGGELAATPSCVVGAAATATCPAMVDVDAIEGLAVGLVTSGVTGNAASASVRLTVTDASAVPLTVTLDLVHANTGASPSLGCTGQHLRTVLTTSAGTPRYALIQCGLDDEIPTAYQFDLFDARAGLRAALAPLTEPLAVTLSLPATAGGATASAMWAGVWTDTQGDHEVAGTGLAQAFAVAEESSVIEFQSASQHAPPQALSLQGGAVVRRQNDGQAVATDPAFSLSMDGTRGHLAWTLAVLDAGSSSSGGQGSATVTPTSVEEVLLTTDQATFTLGTDEAAAWQSFFRAQRLQAGAGAFTAVGGDASTATLELESGVTWTVRLTIVHASVVAS